MKVHNYTIMYTYNMRIKQNIQVHFYNLITE